MSRWIEMDGLTGQRKWINSRINRRIETDGLMKGWKEWIKQKDE